jgi:hypothetical protein
MLKLASSPEGKQVYTDNREELTRWLSLWAVANDAFKKSGVNSDWIRITDKNGKRQYYVEFFGKYKDTVNEKNLLGFNEAELLKGIEHKLQTR